MKNPISDTILKKNVREVYEKLGQSEAFAWIVSYNQDRTKPVPFEYCKVCETDSPSLKHECLLCGQETQVIESATKKALHKQNIMVISENALLDGIVRELEGRETFGRNEENERIFDGSIFETILNEQFLAQGTVLDKGKKVYNQLQELSKLVDADYVMVTMN